MIFELIIIIIMLAFNAVFAAYEMGIASISHSRIRILAEAGRKGSAQALFMKERMEGTLSAIQIGITVVGMIAAATGGAGIEENLTPLLQVYLKVPENIAEVIALLIFVAPLSVMTITFAELTPKVFAIKNNEKVVLSLSPVMKLLYHAIYPVVIILASTAKFLTSSNRNVNKPDARSDKIESLRELKAAVSMAKGSRLIGKHGERIVLSAAQLSLHSAREIMIPLSEVFMLWSGSTIADAFVKAHLDMHTRFPVHDIEDEPHSVSGYVNFKDILSAPRMGVLTPTLNTIKRPIRQVDGSMALSQLLEIMIKEKIHIVVVVDKTDVLGILTIEDILEELVGEMEDEYDIIPNSIKPYGSAWIAGGNVTMGLLISVIGLPGGNENGLIQEQTLSEWCSQRSRNFPNGGDVIESGGLRVIPRKFRRGKMVEAIVSAINGGVRA